MNLSDKAIRDFQAIYKKKFDKSISYEDAHKKGLKLVQIMHLAYQREKDS